MDKKEFIAALEELGWPKEEYVILSGGSLLMRGLRETTADIDVGLSKHLAEEISLHDAPQDEKGCYNPRENVQALANSDEIEYDTVDGYQCEALESILAFKKKMMRPKDLKDIEKIEAALRGTA